MPSDDVDASLYGGDGSSLLDPSASVEQEEAIRQAIRLSQPLVGPKEPFTALQAAYADNPKFLQKLRSGASAYSHVRRVRGDGNCFYRSILFSFLEFALLPPLSISPARHFELVSSFYAQFTASPTAMLSSGVYTDIIVDDFYETTLEVVHFATQRTLAQQGHTDLTDAAERSVRLQLLTELEAKMNDEERVQWYITWLRCLTSYHLQTHPDDYAPYMVDHPSVKAFCTAEVDGINREADAPQILALCTEMQLPVHIEYLDNSDGPLRGYSIPEGRDAVITVLYRPGHYDIIYRTDEGHKAGVAGGGGRGGSAQGTSERKEAME